MHLFLVVFSIRPARRYVIRPSYGLHNEGNNFFLYLFFTPPCVLGVFLGSVGVRGAQARVLVKIAPAH